MHIALKEAMKASIDNEVPVGAVIVHKGKIVSQNHNLVRKNIDPTAHAELKRVYFGAYDEKFGAIENGVRFFSANTVSYVPEIYGGLEQAKASKILQEFFKKMRNIKLKNAF